MNYLKLSGNSSYKDEVADFLYQSYVARGGAAQFIVDQTDLFSEHDGRRFYPYPKQVHFMNLLKPTDRVIVVLKSRQCLVGSTNIHLPNKTLNIEQLYKQKYRGKILTLDESWNVVEDEVIDIWEAGKKDVYRLETADGESIISSDKHVYNTLSGWKKLKDLIPYQDVLITQNGCSQVNRIVKLKKKQMTYDLTTKKYHSYIANGIHVHNSGFSTSVVGRAVYEAMFNKVPEIIIISATRTAAEKVLDRIQKAFESMHVSIRPEFKRANKQYLEFFNGVKIYSLASNPDGMRGFTGIAYLDEFAMLRTTVSEEAYKAVYPMTTKGGRIVIISTPKGCEGKFYDLATKSLAEISGQAVKHEKVMYKINWRDVPFIKDAVEQNGLFDGLSPEEIRQEYELEFLTDDEMPFFSQQFLMDNFVEHDDFDIPLFTDINDLGIDDSYIDDYEKPLDSSLYLKNNQNISHLYDRYESYTFGFDPASTNDDSMFIVLGKRRGLNKKEVVGEFILNKITENTIDQAKFSLRLVDMFNPNALNLDYNGLGRGIGDFYKSVERVEDVLNCIEYTRQSKVDDFQDLKDEISKQQIKRRYDGNKDDTYKLKQAQRLFYKDGRIFGKGGKDDYFNAVMLANKYDESVQAGFYFA